MQIGITSRTEISSLKKLKPSTNNFSAKPQLANSDTVSFTGLAEIKAAEKIVKKHAIISGGLGLTLAQVVGVDSAALLANNAIMIKAIAKKVYKSKIDKVEVNKYLAAATLTTTGLKAASGILTFIPVIGNIANTIISAGITKTAGDKFIKLCEKSIV